MPTQKTRNLYPSVVVTSTLQAIMVCHFFIMEHILSRVKLIPWKLVRQCLPWTSSQISLMEISLVAFKDTSLKTIRRNLGSYGPGNHSLSDLAAVEHARGFDIIPVLLGEGVDDLLFASFLAFSKPLILSYCHD